MSKHIPGMAVLLAAAACFGCARAKPQAEAMDDLAKEIAETPKPGLSASEEIYQQLLQGKLTPPSPAKSSGPLVGSQEGLSTLVQKAGYMPRTSDPGMLPYFEALASDEAERQNLPEGLKVIYTLSNDKKNLIFLALVRPLSADEEGDMQNRMSENPVFAQETVAKLNAANPDPKTAFFGAHLVPTGMSGDAVSQRPMLVLEVAHVNDSANAKAVGQTVAEMVAVLRKTQALWEQ